MKLYIFTIFTLKATRQSPKAHLHFILFLLKNGRREQLHLIAPPLAKQFELKRNLFKAFLRDPEVPPELREQQQYKLAKLPRNSSFTRLRNRCIFTGRSRGVYQLFRMSRIVFRELASKGALPGVKKASW
ncbi:hypothetical protein ACJW31_04G072700 [Castanea mollissima]